MSFQIINTHTKKPCSKKANKRKEKDSLLAHHFAEQNISNTERTSAFTSKGSITIEAAMAVPFFFFAVLCLVSLLEMMSIQTVMRSALHGIAKETAKEAFASPVILPGNMERDMVKRIGEERLNRSMVYGGSKGLSCQKKRVWTDMSVIELSVRYQLKIPFLMFRIPLIVQEEKVRVKGWTGYEKGGFGTERKEIVYITETGVVYHKDADCSYLELSVRAVPQAELEGLRNDGGGKYYPCVFCMGNHHKGGYVYITDTGDRYHSSLACGGLKRTVYAVELSEVYGRGGCSRCVK